jgi:pimeloyl-ACP methyl ester carboxylesterase
MIKYTSRFKNPELNIQFLENWKSSLEKVNGCSYGRIDVATSLGNTVVWTINESRNDLETLVCFPGARTSILYWDLDNALRPLKDKFRIYLVETNGQPNLSDLNSPEIHSNDYGIWASELFEKLGISEAYIAGASFGGLVCLRLSLVAPGKIKKIFLLCPAGIQSFSMSFKNLYYNILPIIAPSRKNIKTFLNAAVLCKPSHWPSDVALELLVDHAEFALKNIVDKTQKPISMPPSELQKVQSEVVLFCGKEDLLFPGERTVELSKKFLSKLKHAEALSGVAHGIELYKPVYDKMLDYINLVNK